MIEMLSVVLVGAMAATTLVGVLIYRKLPESGNIGFKIGYYLYSKTYAGYMYYQYELSKAKSKLNGSGHSVTRSTTFNDLTIFPVPMSRDNYGYLIYDKLDGRTVLIDPADPDAIQVALKERNLCPVAILTTHKHWDHSAGNYALKKLYPNMEVFGGRGDQVPGITEEATDDQVLEFGRLRFSVRHTPGHTVGHVVYILDGAPYGAPLSLFSGDHLFIGGIGKLFEGSAPIMLKSLDRLCLLPDNTLLWPGHEYSLANTRFALHLQPENIPVAEMYKQYELLRGQRLCTSPSTLGAEKTYNPFLRTHDNSLASALCKPSLLLDTRLSGDQRRALILAELRAQKDKFKFVI